VTGEGQIEERNKRPFENLRKILMPALSWREGKRSVEQTGWKKRVVLERPCFRYQDLPPVVPK
jgi:hypothetical protein